MVESEIAGNFPNQNNHHFVNAADGGSQKHHGQDSQSNHDNMHEDNENQHSDKGDKVDYAN